MFRWLMKLMKLRKPDPTGESSEEQEQEQEQEQEAQLDCDIDTPACTALHVRTRPDPYTAAVYGTLHLMAMCDPCHAWRTKLAATAATCAADRAGDPCWVCHHQAAPHTGPCDTPACTGLHVRRRRDGRRTCDACAEVRA